MLCPISYEPCDQGHYSSKGLKLLSPKLTALNPFPYSQGEAAQKAAEQKGKMSISGAQPKLGAQLSLKNKSFEITTKGGAFILKPNNPNFVDVPANEAATMHIAAMAGIDVPLSGMIYDKNDELIYFIKRFDRIGKKKLAVEDFGQLLGYERSTKYNATTEDLVKVVRELTSFPVLEMPKLYRLILFNFLVGNEDSHVKNFSLITDTKGVVRISPAYDLVNTSVVYPDGKIQNEEVALSLNNKKQKLSRDDIEIYLGNKVMELDSNIIGKIKLQLTLALQKATNFIYSNPFLSFQVKMNYLYILSQRRIRLGMHTPLPLGTHKGYFFIENIDGISMARLEVKGTNLLFSTDDLYEKLDGKLVEIISATTETRIRAL